jgi:acyl-CoA reductase-like NAD-dependent aldehyde dehydrogenase
MLKSSAASNMKRLLLECGGKAPGIVFDDCPDVGKVANVIVQRAFWNQGQVCTAISRLLVHKGIRKHLIDAILERASRISPQDPLDEAAEHGALVSQGHKTRVLEYVEAGLNEGARPLLRIQSRDPVAGGYYLGPVIFDQVEPHFRVAREEIFGPVLSILDFADEHEAIEIANGTIYGLSATVWTQNLGRAHRMAHALRSGSIVVNATAEPRGGPGIGVASSGGLKQSGIGVEGGIEGLREYACSSTIQMYV